MSFTRELQVSLGVQGGGAAAVLLATVLLGKLLGPEVQGGFSHVKAEVEFISAFAMFGLPQALFFYVKSGQLAGRTALHWTMGCAVAALPLAAAWALWNSQTADLTVLLALAVAASVTHGLVRGLLLVSPRTAWFSVFTALPQVLVLIGVLCVVIVRGTATAEIWLLVFALAYALSALVAWRPLERLFANAVVTELGWRTLVHYGMGAWLTSVLVTAAILFVQGWVETTLGRGVLGQFTMAMTLVQVPLTPISYAAPLLLRRWMERPGAEAARRIAGAVCAFLLLFAGFAWAAGLVSPDLGLGAAYAGATHAVAILLVGAAAEAASRVLAAQAGARGTPWIVVRAEVARWTVLAGGWLVLPTLTLTLVCAVWATGAWAGAAVCAWQVRPGPAEGAG